MLNTHFTVHTLPYAVSYRQFINDNSAQLFIANASKVVLYDCQTRTEVYSSAASLTYYDIRLDQYSKKVTGPDFGQQKVFDISTRTWRSVEISTLYADFRGNMFFTNLPLDGYHYALRDY